MDELEKYNARYRISMREPAILIPEYRLPRPVQTYFVDDSLSLAKEEILVKNTMSTPTQVVAIEKEKVDAVKDNQNKGLMYVILAAIAGYVALN